ncbi:MAG: tetratricopeptide repeat protein [Acidobacteriota bacterium]|nr:tetratricopeptide repeat protein [Acidobacteriota bacterium]
MLSLALEVAVLQAGNLNQQGVDRFKAHQYAAAIEAFKTAAQSEEEGTPVFKESMLMIGQSYFMLSQAPKAIPFLEKVAGFTDADYMLGYAYIQNRQPDLSEVAFARLFHLDSKSASGHLLAGQMLLKKGFEPEAEAELQKALQLNAGLPEANFLLGEIAMFEGRVPAAIKYLQNELSLNPNFSMAWYRLGDAYVRQQQWDDAVSQLQRAIWLNPDFSGPYILLGKCYLKQGSYSNAEGILRKGLKLDPNNASGTYLLGQTLMAEGKTNEAHAEMEKVKSLRSE